MENPNERFKNYKENHCWQYEVRKQNLKQDLEKLSDLEFNFRELKPKDFEVEFVDKSEKRKCKEIKEFIERHEWLGKLPNRPTHRFIAHYNGNLAGVVIMATPNSFSHVLGKEYKHREKLISRGACISWSPKGLGSYLIQQSINWMVTNTEFRLFSAYSDPEAKELGTIYQALNFLYLGQSFGAKKMYFDSKSPEKGWFSSRMFRKVSAYKRYAKSLDIEWKSNWSCKSKVNWNEIPHEIERQIRAEAKRYQSNCLERQVPLKHKYLKLQGQNKRETKELIEAFKKNNSKLNFVRKDGLLIGKQYPKSRGV